MFAEGRVPDTDPDQRVEQFEGTDSAARNLVDRGRTGLRPRIRTEKMNHGKENGTLKITGPNEGIS